MARLQSDEDFKAAVAARLRELGHDVRSAVQAGIANQKVPDRDLLAQATADGRAVLTHNRGDYVRLHRLVAQHAGIIVCRQPRDPLELADQIHAALSPLASTENLLIRVYAGGSPRIEAVPLQLPPEEP